MAAPGFFALIYVSQATAPLSEADLEALLVDARRYNAAVGVTGFLAYERPDMPDAPGTFVQYLEGPEGTVRSVFEDRIRPSSQHRAIEVKREGPVEARSFPDWTMAFERTRTDAIEGFSDLINKLGPPPDPP